MPVESLRRGVMSRKLAVSALSAPNPFFAMQLPAMRSFNVFRLIATLPRALLAGGFAATLLAGCVAPAPVAVSDMKERPAERALLAGIRAYEDAQYPEAEKQLGESLRLGLAAPKDRAAANKYLAFIYCTSKRESQCEAAFRAARKEDPGFALDRAEVGHPLWGPVYRRVLGN